MSNLSRLPSLPLGEPVNFLGVSTIFCRWSDDEFCCDLFCCKDNAGYVTRVATLKYVFDGLLPKIEGDGPYVADKVARQMKARDECFEKAEKVSRGLPFDGMTFVDEDLLSFRERLVKLREAGYRFPDRVFALSDNEMRERVLGGTGERTNGQPPFGEEEGRPQRGPRRRTRSR